VNLIAKTENGLLNCTIGGTKSQILWVKLKRKVCIRAKWPIMPELIQSSVAWIEALVPRSVNSNIKSPVPIHTPGWREAL